MYEDHAIRYGLLNYIAKYSLASDVYLATENSFDYLRRSGFIKDGRLRRGLKSKANKFTYEHPVPCNLIGREIVENRLDASDIARILDWSDKVTVLTSVENERLAAGGLSNKMPLGWKLFEDSPFARYIACGICDGQPSFEVSMTGSLKR